jgi:hypothetical protein
MAFVQQVITIARSLPPPVRAVCADDRSGNVLVTAPIESANAVISCAIRNARRLWKVGRLHRGLGWDAFWQARVFGSLHPSWFSLSFYLSSPLRRQGFSDFPLLKHAPSERGIHSGYLLSLSLPSPLRRQGSSDFALCEHAPAERGIHAVVSIASRRASDFLLRGQEKVTKEKATPKRWSTDSCPSTPRQGSGGLLTAPPCAGSKLGAIPRAQPSGLSCALPPPLTGPM